MRDVLTLFLLAIAASCVAQTDSLFIDAEFNHHNLDVRATYYYIHRGIPTDSLYFTLNPAAIITSIDSPLLGNHRMAQRKDLPFPARLVKLTSPVDEGTVVTVQFNYSLDLLKTNYWKYDWCELMVDQFWYPNARTVTNAFTSRTIVRNVPSGYRLFSYLPHQEIGPHTYQIIQAEPFPETSFLLGKDMKRVTRRKGGLSIDFFAATTVPDSTLQSMFEKVSTSLELFNGSFGKAAPVEKLTLALRPVPRTVAGSQTTRNFMILTSAEFNTWGDLSHELGHFWWNKANFIREPWLNESFANYTMLMILDRFDTPKSASVQTRIEKTKALPGAVATTGVFTKDGFPIYYFKGAALLKELEKEIGRQKMQELLANLVKTRTSTTEGFLSALEAVAGPNVSKNFGVSLRNELPREP